MKIHTVSSAYNSFDKAITIEIPRDRLKAFNQFNQKYTKRKMWVEVVEGKGMRFVSCSFNAHRNKWMKPQREKLYPFCALVRSFGATVKIYVNETQHYTDILNLYDKWVFDITQNDRLLTLIEQRKELYT